VHLNVDVIFSMAGTPAARAAQQAHITIPFVAPPMGDPVHDGLIASLAHPGGHITGSSFLGPGLVAKRLELLKEAVPGASHVAALWNPGAYGERTMSDMLKETEAAAQTLRLKVQFLEARGVNNFEVAFAAMTRQRTGALIVLPSPVFYGEYRRIVDLARKSRLPASYAFREAVVGGGLMSYGANLLDLARRAATQVDKILKGAKPADLPIELPTKFELVINLKTAKALGLTIPPSLLLRANQAIPE
jgi:putative ABC transport system substrate-binding protein